MKPGAGRRKQVLRIYSWVAPVGEMLDVLILVAAGALLLPYVMGPLLIRAVHRQAARPAFQMLDPSVQALPEEADLHLRKITSALQNEGFSIAAVFEQSGYVKNLTVYLALLENRGAQDLAIAVAMYVTVEGQVKFRTVYSEFSTGYLDESSVTTNNCSELTASAPLPQRTLSQLPLLADPLRLYRAHQALLRRVTHTKKKSIPARDELERFLRTGMEKEVAAQVAAGYLYLDASADCYRPTWKGALLMTWKLVWPVSAIRRSRRDRRAAELVQELGV